MLTSATPAEITIAAKILGLQQFEGAAGGALRTLGIKAASLGIVETAQGTLLANQIAVVNTMGILGEALRKRNLKPSEIAKIATAIAQLSHKATMAASASLKIEVDVAHTTVRVAESIRNPGRASFAPGAVIEPEPPSSTG